VSRTLGFPAERPLAGQAEIEIRRHGENYPVLVGSPRDRLDLALPNDTSDVRASGS